jgi:3-hydroxymyristoyl/3-hydroxydecanoyl-(acyl carrier protein) dehydratase
MIKEKQGMIASSHPSLAGHFPGHPITPGVVILDEVIQALTDQWPDRQVIGIPVVKFLAPLRPEQPFTIRFFESDLLRIRFECIQGDGQLLAQGYLLLADVNADMK